MDDLDLPNSCWTPPSGDLDIGDICHAVPMAGLVDERLGNTLIDDSDPSSVFVPARFSYALVLGVMNDYAVLATVGTASTIPVSDLVGLIDRGRRARSYVRLPVIPADAFGVWQGRDGVAFLSHVETFPADDALSALRLVSMNVPGQATLRQRLARLVEPQ